MSRRHSSMRSPLTLITRILACFAVLLALSGCGAGQVTQTDSQVAAIDGASTDIGNIALRDVLLPYPENQDQGGVYPSGSDVPLNLTFVNQGTTPATLVSITTPAARQVLIQGTTTIPPGMSVTTLRDTGTVQHGDTPHHSDARSSTTASAAPVSPLDAGSLRIVLVDTTRTLRPGLNVEVTFVFKDIGKITLPVPMASPDSERTPLESGKHQ